MSPDLPCRLPQAMLSCWEPLPMHLESTGDFAIENGYLLAGQTVRYLNDCFTGELPPSMFDPSGKTPHAVTHRAGSLHAGTELELLKQIHAAMVNEKKGAK